MLHRWLIITCSWFGYVSLQYINTGGPGSDVGFETMERGSHYPLPSNNYNAPLTKEDCPNLQMDPLSEQMNYQGDILLSAFQRKRRSSGEPEKKEHREKRWMADQEPGEPVNAYLPEEIPAVDDNTTTNDIEEPPMVKKYFSPWGGKRNKAEVNHNMWTWKRSTNHREPSMPKRVRFSPWGGKRNGQMIYKLGAKSAKIIYSSSIPELTRIVSNYIPNGKRVDTGGYQVIPFYNKMHPIKIIAMIADSNERPTREVLPFKSFIDPSPRGFKHGHPYLDVNLKKDGKRKVKFSAWGGKRSPPIIGPIWTPAAAEDARDDSVKAILLLESSKEQEKPEQNLIYNAS